MLNKLIDLLTRLAAISACCILIAMVVMILIEIVLRSAFASSTYVLDEFIGYGVATMTFLSFAVALKDHSFIRVNLILANIGPIARRWIEVIACALGVVLFSGIGFYFWKLVARDFTRGTISNSVAEVPLWIPEAIMLLGILILVLQFAALTVRYALGAPMPDTQEEL